MADPIKHVVVLMMENHSFDQLLGCMHSIYAKLEGVDEQNLLSNPDYPNEQTAISQAPSDMTSIPLDPHHEHVNVMRQITNNCGGVISDFVQCYAQCGDTRKKIMAYYKGDSLA